MHEDNELRIHQLKAVEAMKVVDKICEENQINYFFIAGSTLGAIRHGGFIPWDDDIDIAMNMENYNRFIKIIPQLLPGKYRWRHTDVDQMYPTLSGRVSIGEEDLITVFPIIKLSNNKLLRESQWIIRKVFSPVWQRKVGYKIPENKITTKDKIAIAVSAVLSRLMTKRAVLRLLRWNEMRFEDKNVDWGVNLYSKYSLERESIKISWMRELIRVPFEDGEYPIFKDYDAYLTHLYGDYMTPPKEEKRVPEHIQ